jgi:hypothetical protein
MSLATTFRRVLQPRALLRALSVSLIAAFILPVSGAPASAANFLEKLFGVQQQPVAAPRPSVVLPPVAAPSTAHTIRKQKPKSEIVKARPSGPAGAIPARSDAAARRCCRHHRRAQGVRGAGPLAARRR